MITPHKKQKSSSPKHFTSHLCDRHLIILSASPSTSVCQSSLQLCHLKAKANVLAVLYGKIIQWASFSLQFICLFCHQNLELTKERCITSLIDSFSVIFVQLADKDWDECPCIFCSFLIEALLYYIALDGSDPLLKQYNLFIMF